MPLKEALRILAANAGFPSWRELKTTLDLHEKLRPAKASALWHVWYGSYEEAKAHLRDHGGFLLPYQKHYFVCDEHYIANLGLNADDPDLAKVGQNWVEPKNKAAWERLLAKISAT